MKKGVESGEWRVESEGEWRGKARRRMEKPLAVSHRTDVAHSPSPTNPHPHPSSTLPAPRFTLIEMLVTITIIGILAGWCSGR